MSDTNKKKYKETYNKQFELARALLTDEAGDVEWSPHDYEVFLYKHGDVSLVFYPHRTSGSNYHIRIRDNGSTNKSEANRIMELLDYGAGYNCTFSKKAS